MINTEFTGELQLGHVLLVTTSNLQMGLVREPAKKQKIIAKMFFIILWANCVCVCWCVCAYMWQPTTTTTVVQYQKSNKNK